MSDDSLAPASSVYYIRVAVAQCVLPTEAGRCSCRKTAATMSDGSAKKYETLPLVSAGVNAPWTLIYIVILEEESQEFH